MRKFIAILMLSILAQPALTAGYKFDTIAENLSYPWSIAFLPEGGYLVAMRSGEIHRISATGTVGDPLAGTPETYVAGQGGYFDVLLDPLFATNQVIYLSFAAGTPNANSTRVIRAQLQESGIDNVEIIFDVSPKKDTPVHYGGRMVFLADGTLLISTGDGFEYREAAQDTFSQLGKIIRINTDGSVPADNPFADGSKGDPKVYSYGHRNTQGLTIDPDTGAIYMHEHGAQGGDELNLVLPAHNYGWPAVTKGINYSGAYVSPLTSAPGVDEPLTFWVPSIAPSGLAFYQGNAFPDWQGDLLVGALVNREVRRLDLEGGMVIAEEALFGEEIGARIRDVRTGPDGYIYILTDSDKGKIIRVSPK